MIYSKEHVDDDIYCYRQKDDPGFRILFLIFHIYGYAIPTGYRWDGASAPKLLRWLVPKFNHSLMSSCLHDYLCSIAKNAEDRHRADILYKKALIEVEQFSEKRAHVAYLGVRAGAKWGSGVRYKHFIKDNIWPLFGLS